MDVNRSLPTRFRLPSPKPNKCTFTFKYNNEFPINNNVNQNSKFTSLNVIPCQQTLNLHPIGKPIPNRRGRKPLTTMPSGKKHVQNLTNQRAFRQRKATYIRTLEIKASNLEMLYNSAQNEIKSLNDRIVMLEKKLASSRSIRNEAIKNSNNRDPNTHYGGIIGSTMYIYDENKDESCDVNMNDQIPEPSSERIWMASTNSSTTSPLYSTFVASNSSQNTRDNESTYPSSQDSESQWIQSNHPYFAQAPNNITTTAGSSFTSHHPLDLGWILDAPNEE
ncbi:hypothetical protein C1645_792069 [Glomus cerebriforme]|uniref:BZIP domain-containing protein n=1 Tax=Glomus cerebriforme TaxID=658196 RepID=A0A397S8Q3_9GLOM|nr:hypothetical protein C1645_792069 [Glomus cerebriforme]